MKNVIRNLACTIALAALLAGPSLAQDATELPPLGPDDLMFSVDNMDPSVDAADDFYRYASGGWLDRVERPADKSLIGFSTIITDRIDSRLRTIFADAVASSDTATHGSPEQQVGDLYKAFMDVDAIDAAGMTPIQAELDRIAAIQTKTDLAEYLGHYTMIAGEWPLVEVEIFEGLEDAKTNQVYIQPGKPAIVLGSVLEGPADSPAKKLYADYIVGLLTVADYKVAQAPKIAKTSIAIESAMHAGEMDPVLKVDYRNQNNPRTAEQLQAEIPLLPLDTYFGALGLAPQQTFIVTEPDYPKALNGILRDFSTEQIKDYLTYRLIGKFAAMLPNKFEEPGNKLNEAFSGVRRNTPREQTAITLIKGSLSQPLGRLYVEKYFDGQAEEKGLDMIRRMQAAFHKRVVANEWLSESTRKEALKKVDSFYYKFGIPDEWIDYSKLDIGDDFVQDVMNISTFNVKRKIATAGKPVENWAFSSAAHTAPTVVNAAYDASKNGFEVTAGIAQPPTFQAEMDAPIYYCRLGAAIGHEMTHGFDSGGRAFDADGNMRNWWTDADAARFDAEAQKLVEQGNAYEALTDTFMNGGITVKENMADIGGVALAYDALMSYLDEHPEENVEIDGMTPSQRCFVAWAQLWTEKSTDQQVKMQLEDNHPPSPYRTTAPLQHLNAFYEAFDIKEGDPMWLAPEKRVRVW